MIACDLHSSCGKRWISCWESLANKHETPYKMVAHDFGFKMEAAAEKLGGWGKECIGLTHKPSSSCIKYLHHLFHVGRWSCLEKAKCIEQATNSGTDGAKSATFSWLLKNSHYINFHHCKVLLESEEPIGIITFLCPEWTPHYPEGKHLIKLFIINCFFIKIK